MIQNLTLAKAVAPLRGLFVFTSFLFLLCAIALPASAGYAQKLNLAFKKASIADVLNTIEKQSSYRFLYNENLKGVKQKVTFNVQDADIKQVLDVVFGSTGLSYQFMENNLIIIKENSGEKMAAEIPITGKVTAADGIGIGGVTVSVKGTSRGTSTDANGNFSITADEAATLVFSSVGFTSVEEAVAGKSTINVSLVAATSQLEQVVVVGYGTARKKDLTGSVATVSGSELAKQPVLTATQAVQGKVAGVQVISNGDPNALPVIRIRGTGTMLAGANPLYVVDGVINDDIRNINSADIVSMDILKDASATAIYGMRAANGVILITTKRGKSGKMIVNYDATIGVKEATKLVNMAGANQYAGYVNEASVYYGSGDSIVTRAMLSAGANTDWYDEVLKKGFFQNHNISMSGGGEKVNYFLSAGYLTDEGIIRTNDFQRFTFRNNNDYKITNNFKISTLLSYSRSKVRNVDLGVFNVAYRAAPYVPAKVNGKYGNTSLSNNVGNPILDQDKNDNSGKGDRFQGTIIGEYKPISWLTLRTSFGVDKNNFRSLSYGYKYDNAGINNVFITSGSNQVRPKSTLNVSESEGNRWVWDNTATATKSFGDHNFNILVGTTAEDIRSRAIGGTRFDVPEDRDQWYLNAGSSIGTSNFSFGDKSTRTSYLSRLNYNYKDKYFLTATMRADASSRLPENNRWGYFPSVGAGWIISSESFMDNQKTFNNLKLRGSYGRVGNDGIPSSLFIPLATVNLPYLFNGVEVLNIRLEELSDPTLKWEVTREVNVGVDFGLLKNRFTGSVDFYNRKTQDALVRINIPAILGDPNNQYITNAASFTNKGVEVALNWADNISKDWRYNVSVNFANNTNKIDNLNGGQALTDGNVGGQGTTTKSDNGQPIGSFFLWEVDGIFQNAAEIAASAQKNARPGDLRYKDISGPQGKPDGIIDANDRTYQGSYQPKQTFGINGGLTYKIVDISVGGYGTAGGKIYNGKKAARGDFRDNIETETAKNRWTPNNTSTSIPRANLNELPASNYFLEKGDFFRINNLTVGVTIPQASLDRLKIQSLRVYATAQNLATFTNYSGFTPELSGGGTLAGGIESFIYPTTRTFAVGVNVGL